MAAKEAGDIVSLLSTDERDFLVNSNGEKVVPFFPSPYPGALSDFS